ncbi:c-type cytochrome [Oxalobacteraceae bacterium]|nr:c-type cytochrome [Oxalobacteraceae bacterium]
MRPGFPAMPALALALALAGLPHAGASAAADAEAGRKAFARCASCHQIGPSARAAFGPQLNGIVGRPAAATADFKYSPAMINSRIVWTEKNLAAFIKAPGDVVPGTKMRFWGIGDAQQVANLVEYLRTAH